MTRFIFFGRLTHEKGIDLILETFLRIDEKQGEQALERSLDIYGAGPYADACSAAARQTPKITFHGRASQETIRAALPEMDYCLMPSRVIETFGKSAVEALAEGVQVIGYRHGGLEQFIDPALAIGPRPNDFLELIYNIISGKITPPPIPSLAAYGSKKRLERIREYAGNAQRILLVSDFITTGGGIETFLHETKALLEKNGYQVELCGSTRRVGFWGLFATAFNLPERRRVRAAIQRFQPDIIRYNSTLRRMGWLPMSISRSISISTLLSHRPRPQKWWMFHDMGYVYPHPASLTSLDLIPQRQSLSARLGCVRHRSIMTKVLTIAKRCLYKSICYALRDFDRILIPSMFMDPYARTMAKNISVNYLPHFVSGKAGN